MRLVLDTNLIVSGILTPKGPPGLIVHRWRSGDYHAMISSDLLGEIKRVFTYPRVLKRLSIPQENLIEVFEELERQAQFIEVTIDVADSIVRDPKDQMVLALARCGFADYIVTGDKDLLVLESYAGAAIVNSPTMLEILETRKTTPSVSD